MLSPHDESALTSGQDNTLHSHSFDRQITHASLEQMQAIEKVFGPTADYTATYQDDILPVDSTLAPVNITLPFSKAQRELIVVRVKGANTVTITAAVGDTVNGAASISITTSYAPRRIKSLPGLGWVEV